MAKTAPITGITTPDGAHLAESRLNEFTEWSQRLGASIANTVRPNAVGPAEQAVVSVAVNPTGHGNMRPAIRAVVSDEVYNLAARSYVGVSSAKSVITALSGLVAA